MPYVVIAKRPIGDPARRIAPLYGWQERFRRACVTLDEARQAAYTVAAWANRYGGHEDAAYELPESGGTVGPLADGTVVEVVPTTALRLCAELRHAMLPYPQHRDRTDAEVCAAYNNAREVRT